MSGKPLYARLGFEVRPAGSAAALAATIGGMELAASNRVGWYVDLTAGDEHLGTVVGGAEVCRAHNNATAVWHEILGYEVVTNHIRVGDTPVGYTLQDGDIWYDGDFNFRVAGATITGTPVQNGTVDNAMLRWDDTSSTWEEEPNALLTTAGALTIADALDVGAGLTVASDIDANGNLDVAGNTVAFGASGADLDMRLRTGASTYIRLLGVDDGDATDPDDLVISHYDGASYVDFIRLDVSVPQVTISQQLATSGVVHGLSTKTSAYVMLNTDYTIIADASGGAFAITLPSSPVNGQIAVVKKGDSSANAVTITGTVDGVTNPTLASQYDFKVMQWDATASEWRDIS